MASKYSVEPRIMPITSFLKNTYSFRPLHIRKLPQGVANANYLFSARDGSYILKIYKQKTSNEVKFELKILDYLAKKNFNSPVIVKNKKGSLLSVIKKQPAAVFKYIKGNKLTRIKPEILYKIGLETGRLHKILKYIKPKIKRTEWEPDDIKRLIKNKRQEIIRKRFPKAKEILDFISKELEALPIPKTLPKGITHQDIKQENIIIDSNKNIHFIDFDNSYRGVLLYDLLTTTIWTCFKKLHLKRNYLNALLNGYNKEKKLKKEEKKYLFHALKFRLLREAFIWMMLYNSKIARRNCDYFLKLYKNL